MISNIFFFVAFLGLAFVLDRLTAELQARRQQAIRNRVKRPGP